MHPNESFFRSATPRVGRKIRQSEERVKSQPRFLKTVAFKRVLLRYDSRLDFARTGRRFSPARPGQPWSGTRGPVESCNYANRRSAQMIVTRIKTSVFLAAILALAAPAGFAQSGQRISLTVDATQVPEKIVRTHLVMPVKPGPLTLYYPKWIPG